MSRQLTTLQRIRVRRAKEIRPAFKWAGLTCSTTLGVLLSILLVSSSFVYAHLTRGLPSLDLLPLYFEPPNGILLQPTQLFDRTGEHLILTLTNPSAAGSQYLKAEQIPAQLVNAILASRDPSFSKDSHFSWREFLWGNPHPLAQELAVAFLLQNELPGPTRDFRERILAYQMVQRFGQEKILEWYLNTLEFGPLIYGIDAAAHAYFEKPAAELTLAEAAALAALAEDPALNPLVLPQAIEEKRNRILQEMLIQGWATSTDIILASQEKLMIQPLKENENPSLAFANLVFDQLAGQIPYARLARGGFQIITTLDYDLQMQTICATESVRLRLQGEPGEYTAPDGSLCQAARLIPTLQIFNSSAGKAAADVMILDPQTGQVLSLVGDPTSHTTISAFVKHDPGTLLTPFLYLTAFARGFSPGSMLWDLPLETHTFSLTEPNHNYHGPVRLRTALANDYPGPVIQLTNQVGHENFLRTIQQLGVASDQEISLFEAVQAYGILANQGVSSGQALVYPDRSRIDLNLTPTAVLKASDRQGNIWVDWSAPSSKSIISPQLSYLINDILRDETARWQSLGHPNPLEIGRPAGAKIARTTSGDQEWTIGYTPGQVVGVWIGSIEGSGQSLPANISASLWHAVIQYATHNQAVQNWSIPAGIKTIRVCDPSGLLPTEFCPTIVNEIFLEENLPTQPDNLYRKFQINRETGKLATVFTPPELVEDRIFLSIPAEAMSWAQENGLPVPPNVYDPIYSPPERTPTVQITDPVIFTHVRGKVSFTGTAAGEDFQFYRLQVGKGLNPQEWLQIGQDSNLPVKNGLLGSWETQGLSGLYAVQLLVVRKDQRVDRFITQVTVDNQPPQIFPLNPLPDQVFSAAKNPSLLFQIDATDDLEIKLVVFFLDGKNIASLNQPPYALPWKSPPPGKHELRIEATDLAGNTRAITLNFEVK